MGLLTIRLLIYAALLVAGFALVATPAAAYRVFLDYNADDDLETFENDVVGPVTAPITIIVSLDEGDVGLGIFYFQVEWDCADVPECFLAVPHGDIGFAEMPDIYPFSGIEMFACTGLTCACHGVRHFEAVVDVPEAGNWALATLPFTRQGRSELDCGPYLYSEVEFRVQCGDCDYAPGDEPFTRLLLREGAIDADPATWGRVKTLYR